MNIENIKVVNVDEEIVSSKHYMTVENNGKIEDYVRLYDQYNGLFWYETENEDMPEFALNDEISDALEELLEKNGIEEKSDFSNGK
jgi:hypothetical protein